METETREGLACPCRSTLAALNRAAEAGFEWDDMRGALKKVEEEIAEIRVALDAGDAAALRHEAGDLLLAALGVARYLDVSPLVALRESGDRFDSRFATLCELLSERGASVESCTLDELLAGWSEAKVRVGKALGSGG